MIWTAFEKYSTMFIQFISGIILARLLTPHDYGCIGMLSIFMVLSEAFIDGGFGSALIQKKQPSQDDYSTIFFWNIGMSIVLYIVLFFCAPAISRFYNLPLLCDVLRVQGIVLIIYGFNIIQRTRLRKEMDFRSLSIVTVSTSIISLTTTIILAYKGFGVWALVAQNILIALIPAVLFWFYIKWRPSFVFSISSFRELFGFGFYMFLTNLITNFGRQFRGLLIGKIYTSSTMGYYSKASSIERLASHNISRIMNQVTYPIYAKAQDNKVLLINILKRITKSVAFLSFPLMFILILIAKPLFHILYSDRWLDCVPFFQVLCIGGLANCLQSVNLQSISAIGKSKVMFRWAMIKQLIGIVLVVLGLLVFGLYGLLWGAVIHSWSCTLINMLLVSKHIGYKLIHQLCDLLPIFCVTLVAFTFSFLFTLPLNINEYTIAFLRSFIFLIIYVGWCLVFKPDSFTYILDIVTSKIQRQKVKKL